MKRQGQSRTALDLAEPDSAAASDPIASILQEDAEVSLTVQDQTQAATPL